MHEVQGVLEFTISSFTTADEAQEAEFSEVGGGMKVVDKMNPVQSLIVDAGAGVDVTTSAVDTFNTISASWAPLVENMRLFTGIVDKASEVHPYASMAWSILSLAHKTILAQMDRDDTIHGLAKIVGDTYVFVRQASASSQALMTRKSVFGMQTVVRSFQDHSKATPTGLCRWHSPPTASTSSQGLVTRQSVFGMQTAVRSFQHQSKATPTGSGQWHSPPRANTSSLGLMTRRSVFGMQTAVRLFQDHSKGTHYVTSVAFSPDGKHIVSGSNDKTILVWNTDSGEGISTPFEGHTDYVRSVAFSPDGKCIVSGSDDKTIRVWNADSGEAISAPFEGHTDRVRSVAFSPDGKRIVPGSDDNAIRVWDSWLENGWLLNSPRGRLLWIPPWSRSGFWWPANTAVIAQGSTRLDLNRFVHGTSWTQCREPV